MASIRVKAKVKDGVAEVKCLMQHEMETGTRKDDKSGALAPAPNITDVPAEHNGRVVMHANWGPAVSKNPYFAFSFKGASAGDKLVITWVDNKGEKATTETVLG